MKDKNVGSMCYLGAGQDWGRVPLWREGKTSY